MLVCGCVLYYCYMRYACVALLPLRVSLLFYTTLLHIVRRALTFFGGDCRLILTHTPPSRGKKNLLTVADKACCGGSTAELMFNFHLPVCPFSTSIYSALLETRPFPTFILEINYPF